MKLSQVLPTVSLDKSWQHLYVNLESKRNEKETNFFKI